MIGKNDFIRHHFPTKISSPERAVRALPSGQERHPLCRHITNRQIEDLIASKLVTPEQVRAARLQA
ncbi:hypothetical protein [Thioclava sp.]|uniref:hypothetical protein n=1 Tax=Thioclava sp. TaxID=1933450 RepID=UPI003AA8636F